MSAKRDLVVASLAVGLAAAAFFMSKGEGAPAPPRKAQPYEVAVEDPVRISYRREGSRDAAIPLFDVTITGPGESDVRYQTRGGPLVEKKHPITEAAFRDLIERLARIDVFDVDEVPRGGRAGDGGSTRLAVRIRDQEATITLDSRQRPSRDMSAIYQFFDAIRRSLTPEPVSTGD